MMKILVDDMLPFVDDGYYSILMSILTSLKNKDYSMDRENCIIRKEEYLSIHMTDDIRILMGEKVEIYYVKSKNMIVLFHMELNTEF